MASTYVNDLRLNEMATGDASGSWGTVTNTNLELIGEAFSYGTETIGDADSTLTIADGAADAARSFYLKITSSVDLTTTRIVTLGPNTVSKVWMIENATTGSQVITIKQGSGATINVPNGQVKMLATDGAGSGGAVLDLLVDVDLTGTTTLVNLDVSGTALVTGVLTTTAATVFNGGFTANADSTLGTDKKVQFRDAAIYINSSVDGQLDIVADTEIQIAATTVDVNGALDVSGTALVTGVLTTTAATVSNGGGQFNGAINVGVDDTGYDVKFFGATTGKSLLWDESADSLIVTGTTTLVGTTNLDAVDIDGATQIDATVTVGVDDTGYDVKFFGATAGAYMLWDESADDLILGGAAGLSVNSTALVTGVLTTTAATVFNGGFASNAACTITTADNLSGLIVASTDADAQVGPTLQLKRNSGSPADADNLGNIIFVGENDADEAIVYGNIGFTAPDVSDGTEDGLFFLNVINAGTERSRMFMNATETVFNEEDLDLDFRVESDTDANALFVEGSSGNVGIGTSSIGSSTKLQVAGRGLFTDGAVDPADGSPAGVSVGYNIAGGYGFIQSHQTGVANKPLYIQPNGASNVMLSPGGGNVFVGGATSGTNHIIGRSVAYTSPVLTIGIAGDGYTGSAFFGVNNTGYSSANAAAAPIKVGDSTSGRSINAAGTINAAGADYAEYMTKAGEFELSKGDICGINADGKLTNVFADAVAFVVKSTNPSYVGGDTWGTKETIGGIPEQPIQQAAEVDEEGNETQAAETNEDFAARQAQYETDLAEFEAKLETERQKVDRIAFSGQVPVNVTNATAGQYIIPVNDNGAIKGQAVSNPTFEQYQSSVGKVIAVKDGKPTIIVKVV
jgi:hypothetical protein